MDPGRKIKSACSSPQREAFIRAKYERRQFKGEPTIEGLRRACTALGVPQADIDKLVSKQTGGPAADARASPAGEAGSSGGRAMNPALARRLAARKAKEQQQV